MPATPPENDYFLKLGDIVIIGVDLPDMTFARDEATVVCADDGEILLQLSGGVFPQHLPIASGSKVLISKGEGRDLIQCTARLRNADAKGALKIELPKRVVLNERREYVRVDIPVPINYSLPQSQSLVEAIAEWERTKDCSLTDPAEAEQFLSTHKRIVNISGSGLRFRTQDNFSCGTLLHLKIGLPGNIPEHIHAIGSVVRSHMLPQEMNRGEQFSTAVSFRVIENSDRHRLTRHILEEQRKTVMQ